MRIVLVSDTHLAPTTAAFLGNWQAARDFTAGIEADLTIHLGDITVDGATEPGQFAWIKTLVADWPTPLRLLPGNHDIGDNPPSPDSPSEHPLALDRVADFRAMLGPDYWRLDADGWCVIGLNAQLLGSGTAAEAEQWGWLEAECAAVKHRALALMLHKPLFHREPGEGAAHHRYVPALPRQRLLRLLAPLDWRLVASGHVHQYLDRTIGGVRHLWLPSCSYYIPDSLQDRVGEKITGLGVLELNSAGHRFDLVCAEGIERHSALDHPIYPELMARANP